MKTLYTYLIEDGEMATPSNTMGMGNPQASGPDGEIGTEPIEPTAKVKKQKRKKVKESLLDDEEELVDDDNEFIEQFLKDNYTIDGSYKIHDNIIDVKGEVNFKGRNSSLTNDIFKFGKVEGSFNCFDDNKLESLEGGPDIVDGDFNCYHCYKIKSLKGSPHKVTGDFYSYDCERLESLEGAPDEVGGDFICSHCKNLKSLKGLPKKIGGDLDFRFTPAYNSEESRKIALKSKVRHILKTTKYI